MTKWIEDWTDTGGSHSIVADEVHGTHNESHNALSGNPQFNVRLAIAWDDVPIAISRLLGQPCRWPKATPFPPSVIELTLPLARIVAIDARVANDQAAYNTDGDKQIIDYLTHGLVDVTYVPRNGVYYKLTTDDPAGGGPINQPVYINDEEKPRTETIPLDYNKFIWGDTDVADPTPPPAPPTDKTQKLLPAEAPVRFDIGQTLVHTVEGWCGFGPIGALELGDYIGSVTQHDYVSPVTGKSYAKGTLMLRNYNIVKNFNFRSYRALDDPVPTDTFLDFAGRAVPTVEFIYEYRRVGWERFFRPNFGTNTSGYYYIHYATSPYDNYIPFPVKDHRLWMNGTQLFT